MIEPASAIGFALAFLGAAWTASAVSGAAVLAGSSWLRRVGPVAERRAAAMAIWAGPAVGIAIAGTLAVRSLATPWFGWSDHCPAHAHHLHLCWFHGGTWSEASWAVAVLAAIGTVVVARALLGAIGATRALSALRRIRSAATEIAPGVLLAPSGRVFCFVAGQRVYVSTAAWNALDDAGRSAVLAHERAHVARGDLRARGWLGAAAVLGAPWLARRVLTVWRRATEKLCDREAARQVDETAVAQALVALARLGGGTASRGGEGTLTMAFVTERSEVEERVEALLGDAPEGRKTARRMTFIGMAAFASLAAAAIALVDPLHHAIETLLGAL